MVTHSQAKKILRNVPARQAVKNPALYLRILLGIAAHSPDAEEAKYVGWRLVAGPGEHCPLLLLPQVRALVLGPGGEFHHMVVLAGEQLKFIQCTDTVTMTTDDFIRLHQY